MTNTVELFQAENRRLALAPTTVAVFIEGRLCEDLAPVEIVRSSWPEFGSARLLYDPSARLDSDLVPPERIEDRLPMAARISLRQVYNANPPQCIPADLPIFVGRIERILTTCEADDERVEVIARDFSSVLERVTLYGQHVLCHDGSTVFLPGLETVFNPAGRGNATTEPVTAGGKTRTIFSSATTAAGMWTCAEALDYLLSTSVRADQLSWPGVEQLLALTQRCPARDLDVTGLSLLEALHRCCQAAGVQFHIVPRLVETGPPQAVVFYRSGRGRTVELDCQPRGELLSPSRTNIARYQGTRHLYPVTHRYIGQGDFKVYEATFALVPAWDPTLESTNYHAFSPATNPEFHQVRNVYRKWCLNEAGDYSPAPYDQGQPYDLSAVFEGAHYATRRRRFWPALSTDAGTNSPGYFLEVSLDGGLQWSPYAHAFNNLLDECGVWLSSDQLDVYTWVAALKGLLRFRITASIVSDERLTCMLADGPVSSTVPAVDHILHLPHRFQYRKVSPQSLLSQSGAGPSNEVDDSAALYEFVRRQCLASSETIEDAEVRTLCLDLHLHPGDRVVSSPDSRDVLGLRRDNRSLAWIDRVHMDLRHQCTNLRLIRRRVYEP